MMSTPLTAQIYQSTESNGSVIYSDQPTPGSKEVAVPETNIGDSIDIPPPTPVIVEQPEPAVMVEQAPPELEGELIVVEKDKSSKRKDRVRPRPSPRGR